MAEFASKGVAGSGLGLGIAGTALGLLNGGLNGWLNDRNCGCSENQLVNRFELDQVRTSDNTISEKNMEIAYLRGQTETDKKLLEVYKYFDGELKNFRADQNNKWTDQAVINSQLNSGLNVLKSQVNDVTATVASITKTAVPTSAICDFGCGCNSCSIR